MAKFTFHNAGLEKLFNDYIAKGYWRGSIIDYWEKNAKLFPEKVAYKDSRRELTWSQVDLFSDRLALALLDLGLKRDDVLAVQLPWSIEFCLLRGAHEKAGLIMMELAPTLRHQELLEHLTITEARGIVIPWKYRNFDYYQMVEELRVVLPSLEYVIVAGSIPSGGAISFESLLQAPGEEKHRASDLLQLRHTPFELDTLRHTTGTTGVSKLVQSNTAALEWAGRAHLLESGEKIDSATVCGVICPAITGPNIFPFYSSAMVAAKLVLLEHFTPEKALELIAREKVNVIGVVPAQLAMMLEYPNFQGCDLSSLRFIICTSASLNISLALQAERQFGCPVVQHYGSTETGVVTVMQHFTEPQEERLLSVGRPSALGEVKIVDEKGMTLPEGQVGAVVARSPTMGFGYYKDPVASASAWDAEGWCHMGDLGMFDKKGNLALVGRKKDVIIRGGQNIYPLEVENLLLTHPRIVQVAVVAMPDPIMGERACAFVSTKDGETLSFEEMVDFLKGKKVALYKIPERLEIIDKMPLVGDQKVDKKTLQQGLIGRLNSEHEVRHEKFS